MAKLVAMRPISIEIDGERVEIERGSVIDGITTDQRDSLLSSGWVTESSEVDTAAESVQEPAQEPAAEPAEAIKQPVKKTK